MLTKDNNSLFKKPTFEKNKKETSLNRKSKNIVDHGECILQMESLYEKIINNEKEFISNKNSLYKENEYLKDEIVFLKKLNNKFKNIIAKYNYYNNDEMDFGDDIETLYVIKDDDIMSMKKQIKYYEYQFDILNTFFRNNNINKIEELKKLIFDSKVKEKNNCIYRKYDNIEKIIENANINLQSQNNKLNEISYKYNNFNIKLNTIKNKVNKLPIGTILTINGIKKRFKGKIENTVNKIKMLEQEYNEYCEKQIDWAKSIIGDKYKYNEIINLLDIFNKLNKNYKSDDSSGDELSLIFNDLKENKNNEYKIICNLGKYFIDNNIEDKSQIKDIIKNYKKELKHYDANKENKQNRFISTCKRIYLLSQKININDIVKSNCMTFIRDINNDRFNDLLKLIDNNNKKE